MLSLFMSASIALRPCSHFEQPAFCGFLTSSASPGARVRGQGLPVARGRTIELAYGKRRQKENQTDDGTTRGTNSPHWRDGGTAGDRADARGVRTG
jgi:hypothetical protein